MYQTATITSKRQFTIPVDIFRKMNLKSGQKIIVSLENDELRIESAIDLVDRLAGSLAVPERYKKLSIDTLVSQAKKEYLKRRAVKTTV